MGSRKGDSSTPASAAKGLRRKSSGASRRPGKSEGGGCRRASAARIDGGASVSDKLEALKSLVPSESSGEAIKPEQLFQETADYIVLLRTQVIVLQKLIDFYGSQQPQENRSSV